MKLSDVIRKTCSELDVSMSELARRTNQSPQNLSMKLKRDSIGFQEFQEYMEVMGVKIDLKMVYPDGSSPDLPATDQRIQEKIDILQADLDMARRKLEYQHKINTDVRTSLYSVQGYLELIMARREDYDYVDKNLDKLQISVNCLNTVLENSLFEYSSQPVQPVADGKAIKGKRILVVEDNETNLEITRDLLQDNGMIVETAVDGAEAVDKITQAAPGYYDCILMDIQMPVMNGFEATKAIRRLPNRIRANVPIVAMTAAAFDDDRQKSLDVGMDAYLAKPMESRKLLSTLSMFF